MLRLANVGRIFGGVAPTTALADVTLAIDPGEFIAIEGPSGGGKSTLLNVIGLLDTATSGRYEINGRHVSGLSSRELAEVRSDMFGFVFQSFHLLDRRPVMHSVELGLLYRAVPAESRRLASIRALERLGIAHLAWQSANRLSGGERQRVAIARALATGAPIVVADEPTGNLDSTNSQHVVDALLELHAEGTTVILVTHSKAVAASADRRVSIVDGRVDSNPASQNRSNSVVRRPVGRPSRLRPLDLLYDALNSLASRASRTIGLAAAVGVGVALAVGTFGIAESARAQVAETFDAHASRDVSMVWTEQPEGTDVASRQALMQRLHELSGVEHVAVLDEAGDQSLASVTGREVLLATSYAAMGDVQAAARLDIRWLSDVDEIRAGEAIIGENLADQLGIGPLAAGPVILLEGRPIPIVGVIESSPRMPNLMGSIVYSLTSASPARVDRTSVLIVSSLGAAFQVARQAPIATNPTGADLIEVSTPVDPSTVRTEVEADVLNTLYAFTVLALLASAAGLATAMVLSVVERKQEIGLRRAVGARSTHISGLVLLESALVGALGGLVGLLVGFAGILTWTIVRHWTPVFDLRLAPLAVFGGIVVGCIGGALASLRASKIQPSEALRL